MFMEIINKIGKRNYRYFRQYSIDIEHYTSSTINNYSTYFIHIYEGIHIRIQRLVSNLFVDKLMGQALAEEAKEDTRVMS